MDVFGEAMDLSEMDMERMVRVMQGIVDGDEGDLTPNEAADFLFLRSKITRNWLLLDNSILTYRLVQKLCGSFKSENLTSKVFNNFNLKKLIAINSWIGRRIQLYRAYLPAVYCTVYCKYR